MRDPCPSNIDVLHTKLLISLAKSGIPSILIDPESMGFSTIEKYIVPNFWYNVKYKLILLLMLLRCIPRFVHY